MLVWRFPEPVRAIATTVLGGGIGVRGWVLNAEVPSDFHVADPGAHAAAIGSDLGLDPGAGIGFLTAAPVFDVTTHCDGGARCDATVRVVTTENASAPVAASNTVRGRSSRNSSALMILVITGHLQPSTGIGLRASCAGG